MADADRSTFTLVREFAAPLANVWRAWSEADRLSRWWGPAGCSVEILRFEFHAGGFCHYAMRFDGAPTSWGRFAYRQIVAGERLVWLNSFANERCGIARAPFSDDCPLEIENAVGFTERDGRTIVSLRAAPFGAMDGEHAYFEALRPSLNQGYGATLDQLGALLAEG